MLKKLKMITSRYAILSFVKEDRVASLARGTAQIDVGKNYQRRLTAQF